MILDAGFLVAVDRGDREAQVFLTAAERGGLQLQTTEPVVAQVWRDGRRQARLARFLSTVAVHPLDDGRPVGRLLARSETPDVVDAHLVIVAARAGTDVITGDVDDISGLAELLGAAAPTVYAWPPG